MKRLLAALGFLLLAGTCFAQNYPTRAVRIMVPYPPGSGTDIVARLLAAEMTKTWGQPVVVENKPGAGAIVGVDAVAKAAPDGYTIGVADTGPLVINPAIYPKLPYDPFKDLTPVSEIAKLPFMLVANPVLGVSSVPELVAAAKKNPGGINYASVGNGSVVHLASELFCKQAGIQMTHIPYKGSAPALTDVLAGTTPVMFVNLLSGLPHVKSGKLRVLGIGTPARISALPDTPTISEAGVKGYQFQAWFGMMAPAGTPAPVIERVGSEIRRILALPEVSSKLINDGGMVPVGSTAAQFASLIAAEKDHWGKLVKDTGARVE